MDPRSLGLFTVILGLLAVLVGVGVMSGVLGWFGRLPGDVRITNGNTRVFIPITSMIVVSVVLSVGLTLLRRLF